MTNPTEGPAPDEPSLDDSDFRAAEFVLGMLDPAERRAIEMQRYTDPDLAADIAYWEAWLAPLADDIAPIPPPAELWSEIEARLLPVTVTQFEATGGRYGMHRAVVFWQGMTYGAFVLVAAFGGLQLYALALRQQDDAPRYTAALLQHEAQGSGWFAEAEPDGSILLTAFGAIDRPGGMDLELWGAAEGATKPVSLGVLPGAGRYRVPRKLLGARAHMQLLVTVEPKGGSPTGQPTSHPIYGGTLNPPG